jgi:hypothetical protein
VSGGADFYRDQTNPRDRGILAERQRVLWRYKKLNEIANRTFIDPPPERRSGTVKSLPQNTTAYCAEQNEIVKNLSAR